MMKGYKMFANKYKIALFCMVIAGCSFAGNAQVPAGSAIAGAPPSTASQRQAADAIHDIAPVVPNETHDIHAAPQLFIQHINNAQNALTAKDAEMAKKHIHAALNLERVLKGADASPNAHAGYFPLSTVPVNIMVHAQDAQSPRSVKSEKAYLNLDLSGDRAQNGLQTALRQIEAKQYPLAQTTLEDVVNGSIVQVPAEKM